MASRICQLIGYALLDTADEFSINTLGLYCASYGYLRTWPLVVGYLTWRHHRPDTYWAG